MPRPSKCRKISNNIADNTIFKPAGIQLSQLEEINLTVDELEAIRLADLEKMYQGEAAKYMGISRQTFGNIINSAHQKIADSLIHGKALKIEGGNIEFYDKLDLCEQCDKDDESRPYAHCQNCTYKNGHGNGRGNGNGPHHRKK